jgi:hypothetical protein
LIVTVLSIKRTEPVKNQFLLFTCLVLIVCAAPGQEFDRSVSMALLAGPVNYQGDLKPNSFTLNHSKPGIGFFLRKPLNRLFTLRGGVLLGSIEAADKWNRDYLKPRNLSVSSSILEFHTGFELTVLDFSSKKFSPYLYGGLAVFHFNPWTKDSKGEKVYLKPLSTEGQGLTQYPSQKLYQLTQLALAFGGGFKFAISEKLAIGFEINQRKTFTDYLDDVSSHYVDPSVLLQEKGAKAVELAYREDELPTGRPLFPAHGEQRGTPTEKDWYYITGITLEIKLNALGKLSRSGKQAKNQRCPRVSW